MSWSQKKSKISGNLIIDGTVQSDQLADNAVTGDKIADNTITDANLKGIGTESTYARIDEIQVNRYANTAILDFNFPATQHSVSKKRYIDFSGYINNYTGSSTDYSEYTYIRTDIKNEYGTIHYNKLIGEAVHVNYPRTYWQTVKFQGDVTDKIYGSGIGTLSVNRSVGHVYTQSSLGSEILTNGTFSSGSTGWTIENAVLFNFGSNLQIMSNGSGDTVLYQQINIDDGENYIVQILTTSYSSSNKYKAYISPTTDWRDGYEVIEQYTTISSGEARAYGSTAYLIVRLTGPSGNSLYFNSLSVKKSQVETFVEISAYPSGLANSNGTPVDIYNKPFGTTNVNAYSSFNYAYVNLTTLNYQSFTSISSSTYVGNTHEQLTCRLHCYQRAYQYARIRDLVVKMLST